MTLPHFIQIHALTSYNGVLLNRDDFGLAKRELLGDAIRTRVSSQCLKHAWRHAQDIYSFKEALGLEDSIRSRDIITKLAADVSCDFPEHPAAAEITTLFQTLLYGKDADSKKKRQPLLLGMPEVRAIGEMMREAFAATAGLNAKKEISAALKAFDDKKQILSTMRENGCEKAGVTAALFGRMVTSDRAASIEAPVNVAHAFTVHAQQSEADAFTVFDDLSNRKISRGSLLDDKMADDDTVDHKGDTEINSGIFYNYVVINVPALVSNLTGCAPAEWLDADRELAGRVVAHLLRNIAEVSPGAKKGSTAPFGYAHTMLIEAGRRQPRSMSDSFRDAVKPSMRAANAALADYLTNVDDCYDTGEARRYLSLDKSFEVPGAERSTMTECQAWVAQIIKEGRI